MGRRGEVSEAQVVPRQPAALVDEIASIAHVIPQIGAERAQQLGIGWPRRLLWPQPLIELFVEQLPRHLGEELFVKPIDEPAHLGPVFGVTRKGVLQPLFQGRMAHHFAEIFRDCIATCHHDAVAQFEHRKVARRIERQENRPPRPRLLLGKLHRHIELGQQNADRARKWTEPEMRELAHELGISASAATGAGQHIRER